MSDKVYRMSAEEHDAMHKALRSSTKVVGKLERPSGVKLPTSETLLPCPFCGSQQPRLMGRDAGFIYCMNDECGAEMRAPEPYADADAVRMWNTRQPTSPALPTDELIARAEYELRAFDEIDAEIGPHIVRELVEALAMQAKAPATSLEGVGLRETVEGVLKRNMAAMSAACEDGRGAWSAEVVAGKICDAIALAQPTVAVEGLREALVERVARALCDVTRVPQDRTGVDGKPAWNGWKQFARAAIKAIESPIEGGRK